MNLSQDLVALYYFAAGGARFQASSRTKPTFNILVEGEPPPCSCQEACGALEEPLAGRDLSLMRPEVGTDRRSLARTTTIELQHELVVRLRSEAASRQMSVARLVHDLLEVIATDKLTAAILDD